MSVANAYLIVRDDWAVSVALGSGQVTTLTVTSGDTVYYAANPGVTATANDGSLTAGSSKSFAYPIWVISGGVANVTVSTSPLSASEALLQPSGSDDTAALGAANAVGQELGLGTFLVAGGVVGTPRGQGPGKTILQATNAAASIQHGPALGVNPTVDPGIYGGFTFDGNGLATTCAIFNTANSTWLPMEFKNGAGDGPIWAGQNGLFHNLKSGGHGNTSLVLDNGCGDGHFIKSEITRSAISTLEIRQSVAAPSQAYAVPTDNLFDGGIIEEGGGTGTNTNHIRQLAGNANTFRDMQIVGKHAIPLFLFQPNPVNGLPGGAYANGRTLLQNITWVNAAGGDAIEARNLDGSSNAQGFTTDILFELRGLQVFSGPFTNCYKSGTLSVANRYGQFVKYAGAGPDIAPNGTGAVSTWGAPESPYAPYGLVIPWYGGQDPQGIAAATWVLCPANILTAATNLSNLGKVYIDPADYPGFGALFFRVLATCDTDATPPGINFTFGLYPVTAVGGGTNVNTLTLGTVVTGSTVAFNTPAANTAAVGNSGDFAAPAAGHYVLGMVSSGTTATSSATILRACLQYHRK